MSFEIAVGTYNAHARVLDALTRRDVVTLSDMTDICGYQEMGKHKGVLENLDGVDYYCPDAKRGQASSPIAWNVDTVKLLAPFSIPLTPATYVGSAGAGPNTMAPKYLNGGKFLHIPSGRKFLFANHHATPSVEGRGGGPNRHHPQRVELIHRQLLKIARRFNNVPDSRPAFLTGDFNVNYRKDRKTNFSKFPHHILGGTGLKANWGAFDLPLAGRLIDYVWYKNAKPVEQDLYRLHSDHKAVVVKFTI